MAPGHFCTKEQPAGYPATSGKWRRGKSVRWRSSCRCSEFRILGCDFGYWRRLWIVRCPVAWSKRTGCGLSRIGTSGTFGKHTKPASLSRTRPRAMGPHRGISSWCQRFCSRRRTRSPVRRYPNLPHFDPIIQTRNRRLPCNSLFSHRRAAPSLSETRHTDRSTRVIRSYAPAILRYSVPQQFARKGLGSVIFFMDKFK